MNINLIEGKVIAPEGMRVGIVASRFNSFIVEKLLEGAVDGLAHAQAVYIVGEGNMYNRFIPEYSQVEEDIKKEQARIEYELLTFEQDLWEY